MAIKKPTVKSLIDDRGTKPKDKKILGLNPSKPSKGNASIMKTKKAGQVRGY